ncbi:MAG: GTP-binding protein [Promethearchaeota archaeon]
MSLLHDYQGRQYVVNLVDTPGHVDFSGKVTRAMRAIDGAIVVVDAVEGVMAQTESVIRSAIREAVKPVLFINKVDRLIRELKLSAKQVQERFTKIIQDINSLISALSEVYNDSDWSVSPDDNTVAFGSALHQWAFTVKQMHQANLQFQNIIRHYQNQTIEDLSKKLPIHKPILNMILEQLPSPKNAQPYRTNRVWKGELESPAGLTLQQCNPNNSLIVGITKIVTKSKHGIIAVGRLFSGTIRRGSQIRIFPNETLYRTQRVTLFMGSRQVVVPSLTAGNICGIIGIENPRAGDTITGQNVPQGMVPFEEITYINEPVITIAVEPKHPRELPRLLSVLEIITKADPNLISSINEQTGENLLSGLGLLHLEIALKDIEELGVQVEASDPIVLYREIPKTKVTQHEWYLSPNGENAIKLSVHPRSTEPIQVDVWQRDPTGNTLLNLSPALIPESAKESIISGFHWAMERGPLCAEPVGQTLIKILNLKLSENVTYRGKVELMSMVKEAIFEAFENAEMTLLEPIYSVQVTIPSEYLKEVTGVISSRRGQIENVEQKGSLISVSGNLPVSESFDLADDFRSKTSGKAIWQTRFAQWNIVPDQKAESIITSIRKRKGLA